MTLDAYMSLGRAEAILSKYIPEVLSSFREQDRGIAREILKVLVSPEHRKAVVSLNALLKEIHEPH